MRDWSLASLLISVLVVCARQDMREQRISLWPLLLSQAVAVLWRLTDGRTSLGTLLMDGIPGIGLFLLCRLRPDDLGEGDAWMVLTIGLCLGWQLTLTALFLAAVAASLVGTVGLLSKRLRGDSGLPFIPFLLGAVILIVGYHLLG